MQREAHAPASVRVGCARDGGLVAAVAGSELDAAVAKHPGKEEAQCRTERGAKIELQALRIGDRA